MTAPRLTIVCPCYNEEKVLVSSAEHLRAKLDELSALALVGEGSSVLFVNDGSCDNTWSLIEELHQNHSCFDGLNLAHNVGHQAAILAGMLQARMYSEVVITMDVDLQDDLNAIDRMLEHYLAGYDVVYGVKRSREADSWAKRNSAMAFYRLQELMGIEVIYNHADFRLLSQRALNALAQYEERNLYLRGLIPQLGFPSAQVDDVIGERLAGESKYTLQKMLLLAADGITSFSTRPLEWIIKAGLIFLLIALAMVVYILGSYLEHKAVSGWASIMLSLWFIGALILLSIGVVGHYVGKIYIEVKHRPRYHIEGFLHHER